MRTIILIICVSLFSTLTFAKKVNYKYKKYERFDFDALDIEGSQGTPGDLSIGQRLKKNFKNKLPERKDFNREMKKAIDTII